VTGLQLLHPQLQPWARWLIAKWPHGRLTSTWRSSAEQLALYQACGHGECRYPAAAPGHSFHQLGRAFDYVAPLPILEQLGRLWESVGGTWGGTGDPIHFQA
jgi:hypothetical protein